MDAEYYKLYYKVEREHWWFKARAEILKDQIRINVSEPGLRILNIGAATYKTSEMLSEFGEVTSVEYDADCCEFVTKELKKEIFQGDATALEFENNVFDIVCAFDVIEHIEDHSKAMTEMYRVCKDKGLVFITVPAYQFLWTNHDEINHHFRRYNKSNFRNILQAQTDRRVNISYFNTLLFVPIAFVRLLSRFKKQEKVQSDFETYKSEGIVNILFYHLFVIEKYLLRYFRLPFGVSLIAKISSK